MTRHRPSWPLAGLLSLLLLATACTAGSGAQADADPELARTAAQPDRILRISGPEEGELLNATRLEALRVAVTLEEPDAQADLTDVRFLLDGEDVTRAAELAGGRISWAPGSLDDGEYVIAVASQDPDDADEPELEVLREWAVTVDATLPTITLSSPEGAIVANQPIVVAGTTKPGARVEVGDQETTADEEGRFEIELDGVPEGPLRMRAVDAAGNEAGDEASFVVVPSRAHVDEIRSVHVSFCAWATPSLREPVMQLIEDGLITAVQLDIKDETGKIGPATQIELAQRTGADQPDCRVDLPAAVEELHALGVPVIGRIVAFADPVLARWAWDNDERDMVIQTAGGEMFTGKYAGFGNFANEDVIAYNLAVAEEAAAAGVDHILWDYLRKPDGAVENFTFVGLETEPMEAIAEFTRLADERLAPYGVLHGASLYGVSADRPKEVAQDVAALAEHLDYVAPMIYPSHWGPGEYGVANPLMQPHDMVYATLEVWLEATEGKRARVIPWLEDSNWPIRLGYPDRAGYIREQIRGTYDRGIDEWLLWDSAVKYTRAGMVQP